MEMFDLLQRQRNNVFSWMRSNTDDANIVMEAIVLVLTSAEGLDKALASQRSAPRSWSSINAPHSNGRYVTVQMLLCVQQLRQLFLLLS